MRWTCSERCGALTALREALETAERENGYRAEAWRWLEKMEACGRISANNADCIAEAMEYGTDEALDTIDTLLLGGGY